MLKVLALAGDHHVIEVDVIGEGLEGMPEDRHFVHEFGHLSSFCVRDRD